MVEHKKWGQYTTKIFYEQYFKIKSIQKLNFDKNKIK